MWAVRDDRSSAVVVWRPTLVYFRNGCRYFRSDSDDHCVLYIVVRVTDFDEVIEVKFKPR